MWPIRTAVSGKQMTPGGATELMEILGKEESIARIKKGIELLSKYKGIYGKFMVRNPGIHGQYKAEEEKAWYNNYKDFM